MRLVSCKNWSAVIGTPSSLTAAALKAAEKLFVTFELKEMKSFLAFFKRLPSGMTAFQFHAPKTMRTKFFAKLHPPDYLVF